MYGDSHSTDMHPARDAATLGASQEPRDTDAATVGTRFDFFTLPFRTSE
jgi:hypothetical protein